MASRSDERTKRLDGEKSRSSSDQRAASREGFPRAFGGYMLLGAFGKGGMGEVYLARRGGIEGIEKLCVLKLLRADLATEKEYVGRFLDEARVVIGLQHANICPVFDVGRVQDALYLAMEYLHGVNLRHVTDRLLERTRTLEPEVAVHIVASTLAALHHAHRHEDPATGEALHVVHRDVSPHNVMITFQGEVKLIDFGLAASTVKKEETESQLVMGKVAYMSPEQARGEPVDARTDQFATAILLYELLVGERFYGSRKTHEIWQVVGPGGYLPAKLDSVDESLRPILLRALADQPDARFASCEDLREELLAWLARRAPSRTERALRELMQDVFQDDIEAQRAMAQRLLSHDDDADGDPTFSSGATILSTLAKDDRAAALPRGDDEGATVGSSIENAIGPPATDRKTPSRASHPSSKSLPTSGRSGGRPARSEHDSSTEATLSSTKLPLAVPPKQRPPAMAALVGVAVVGALLFVGSGVLGPREATPDIATARTSTTSTSTTVAPPPVNEAPTEPSPTGATTPNTELAPPTTTTTPTDPAPNPSGESPAEQTGGAAVDVAVDPSAPAQTGETPRETKPTPRTTPRPRPPVTGPVAMPVVDPPVAPPAPVVELPPPSTTATTPPTAPPTPAATETPPPTTTTPKKAAPPDVAAIYARIERCPAECAKTVLKGASLAEIQADPARLQAFLTVANNCLPRCPK